MFAIIICGNIINIYGFVIVGVFCYNIWVVAMDAAVMEILSIGMARPMNVS